jgi:predicted DNA-binding protein
MRKRDRERIVKNIDIENEPKQGSPISVRPYGEDHKKLEEIAEETGENKASIVRRMIHFALNERKQHFAAGRCQEKLDWLVRTGRQNETVNLSLNGNLAQIREGVDRLESELDKVTELLEITRCLATELYSMSSMSISSLNLVFTKLIEYASPDTNDRKKSVVIASTAMAELIDHAVTDLKRCLLFHEHAVGDDILDRSYLGTKIQVLKQRIESIPKMQNQQSDAS